MCHKDFRIKQNITMGIYGKYEQSGMQHSKECRFTPSPNANKAGNKKRAEALFIFMKTI